MAPLKVLKYPKIVVPGGWLVAKVGSPVIFDIVKVTIIWPFCQGLKSGKDLGFGVQKTVKIWCV